MEGSRKSEVAAAQQQSTAAFSSTSTTAAPAAPIHDDRSPPTIVDQFAPSTVTFAKPLVSIPPYRAEAFLMTFATLISFIFEIVAASTGVFHYQRMDDATGALTAVTVYHQSVKLCIQFVVNSGVSASYPYFADSSNCNLVPLSAKLCDAMSTRVSVAGGFAVTSIILSLLGIVNGIMEVQGKAFISSQSTIVIGVLLWITLTLHFSVDSAAYLETLCGGTSLSALGFTYRSGWVLGFVAWLLVTVSMVVYVCRRRRDENEMEVSRRHMRRSIPQELS